MNLIEAAAQDIQQFLESSSAVNTDNISLELNEIAARHGLVLSTSSTVGVSIGARGFGAGFAYDSIEGGEVRIDVRVPAVKALAVGGNKRLVIDFSNSDGVVEANIFNRTVFSGGPVEADLYSSSNALFGSVGAGIGPGVTSANVELAFGLYDFNEYIDTRFSIEVDNAISDFAGGNSLASADTDRIKSLVEAEFRGAFANNSYFTIRDAAIPVIVEEVFDGDWGQFSESYAGGSALPDQDGNVIVQHTVTGADMQSFEVVRYNVDGEVTGFASGGSFNSTQNAQDGFRGTAFILDENGIPIPIPIETSFQNGILRIHEILKGSCFLPGTPIEMWPLESTVVSEHHSTWQKPIEDIAEGDLVVSFNEDGNKVPGKVTRTFVKDVKIVLDFFGTGVTPGHVYYRADSDMPNRYETLIDILRADGVIETSEGQQIRAATGLPLDDPRDAYVWAVTGDQNADGTVTIKDRGQIRLGTRFITDDSKDFCVAELIQAGGGTVDEDGLVRVGDTAAPFHWAFGDMLPKPEDYILQRSGTTLEDIYKAGEWEDQCPHMPPPMVRDGGPVQQADPQSLNTMPRNTRLADSSETYAENQRPMLNRKQRLALAAKQRKAGARRIKRSLH